ncbi:MAG: hypothetical protein Q8J89_17075 [Caulobacter sp.]|nr:hypothetical protein [Caulobacter sp.]
MRASLAARGWARAADAVPKAVRDDLLAAAASAHWTPQAGEDHALDTAPLTAPDLMAALGATSLRLIRHAPGQWGLPPAEAGRIGLVLDLISDWPSAHGGLLLVQDGEPLRGWRPEPGALTLFDRSRPPTLSLVTPAARTPRLAVLGVLQDI